MKLQVLWSDYPSLHSSGIILGTSFCSDVILSLWKYLRSQGSWRITEAAVKRQLRAMVLTCCAAIRNKLQWLCKTPHAITHFPQPGGLQPQTTCGLSAIYHISQEKNSKWNTWLATSASFPSPTGYTFYFQMESVACFNPLLMKNISENIHLWQFCIIWHIMCITSPKNTFWTKNPVHKK